MVVRCHTDEEALGFIAHPALPEITQRGTATPDHVIRTKPWPLLGRDVDGFVRRYPTNEGEASDGLTGEEGAFLACSFWLADGLRAIGRREEAREIFEVMLGNRNPLGLLSEDTHPVTGEMWGNFPQAYSHAGLIQAAFATSPRWADVL